jgi:hypothetical protein
MNWNAVGAVGQILGSLATFVTVGYLAVQVHDSETESRRALAQTRVERDLDFSLSVNNKSLADVELKYILAVMGKNLSAVPASSWYTAMASFMGTVAHETDVSMADAYLLEVFYVTRWNNFAETIFRLDELLPMDRSEFDHTLRATFGNPGFAFWYQTFKPALEPQAVSYVDSLNIQVGAGQSLSSPVKAAQPG